MRALMKKVDVVLAGFGNVGRAFTALLHEKRPFLEKRYGLALELRAVHRSNGGIVFGSPAAARRFTAKVPAAEPERGVWDPNASLSASLPRGAPGVLVLCTSSDLRTGEPGLRHIRLALARGWNVVTADKGPLVAGLKILRQTALKRGLKLGCSAAAGAALPALDCAVGSLAGAEITEVEGILNGTSNYILTRMGQGAPLDEALREAQAKGIAEPDPSRDIDGRDTAVKLLLLGNLAIGLDLGLDDIEVQPMTRISPESIASSAKRGEAVKYLGRIRREKGKITAEVRLRAIPLAHPLFGVDGTSKGVTFLTDTMGTVTVTGGKSDPRGAAAALLKDIINIYHHGLRPRW